MDPKLLELLRRFVVAAERIADALEPTMVIAEDKSFDPINDILRKMEASKQE